MSKPKYDSTVARMAGNIAAGLTGDLLSLSSWDPELRDDRLRLVAVLSVQLARAIVAETKRTEPEELASTEPEETGLGRDGCLPWELCASCRSKQEVDQKP